MCSVVPCGVGLPCGVGVRVPCVLLCDRVVLCRVSACLLPVAGKGFTEAAAAAPGDSRGGSAAVVPAPPVLPVIVPAVPPLQRSLGSSKTVGQDASKLPAVPLPHDGAQGSPVIKPVAKGKARRVAAFSAFDD